jgi:hypothetical protein
MPTHSKDKDMKTRGRIGPKKVEEILKMKDPVPQLTTGIAKKITAKNLKRVAKIKNGLGFEPEEQYDLKKEAEKDPELKKLLEEAQKAGIF